MDDSTHRVRIEPLKVNGENYSTWQLLVGGSILRAGAIEVLKSPAPVADKITLDNNARTTLSSAYSSRTLSLECSE
jgi:hypothetical protein